MIEPIKEQMTYRTESQPLYGPFRILVMVLKDGLKMTQKRDERLYYPELSSPIKDLKTLELFYYFQKLISNAHEDLKHLSI